MIDLDGFYKGKVLQADKCYETCDGGHCCKLYDLFTHVKFAPKDSLLLYLYPFEYEWLKKNNQLDPKFEETLRNNEFEVDGKKLNFYTVNCGYGGLCPNHEHRPLTCFLYPYIPYFNEDGSIMSLHNYSIYDDMYDGLSMKKPCTVYDKFKPEMYQELVDKYLNDPEFLFYTNVYVRIKEVMVKTWIKENQTKNINEAIGEFELLYLMQKLITAEEASEIVRQENKKFNYL